MDYSVGSLSDLITGAHTPNKPKVVKKTITPSKSDDSPKIKVEKSPKIKVEKSPKKKLKSNVSPSLEDLENTEPAKLKIKKPKKQKLKVEVETEAEDINEPIVKSEKKSKKRKAAEPLEEIESPKKSKNDENAERRVKKKDKIERTEVDPEENARTVFVGNLPIDIKPIKFKKYFMKYGNVDTCRIRGIAVANPKTSKKVAVIKKEFHPERNSVYGYVRFDNREDAIKATAANGLLFKEHHLRVHLCDNQEKPDEAKAIFIGNLVFNAEEDDLWQVFEACGPISSVRIVRDGRTGMGRGFGYVNFQNSDSVALALELEKVELKGRELRIGLCNMNAAKKNKKKNNREKRINKPGGPKKPRMVKNDIDDQKSPKKDEVKVNNSGFQGGTFSDKKKKNKVNKGLLLKKKIAKKLAPSSS